MIPLPSTALLPALPQSSIAPARFRTLVVAVDSACDDQTCSFETRDGLGLCGLICSSGNHRDCYKSSRADYRQCLSQCALYRRGRVRQDSASPSCRSQRSLLSLFEEPAKGQPFSTSSAITLSPASASPFTTPWRSASGRF